jgi:hypothetical protein
MKEIRFEEKDKLSDILETVQNTTDHEIEIATSGSDIWDTQLNKKVITLAAEKQEKKISFRDKKKPPVPQDQAAPEKENLGFVEGKDVAEEKTQTPVETTPPPKKKGLFPKIPFLKGPKWIYFVLGFIGLLLVAGFITFWFLPSATVKLFTAPQFQEAEFSLVASEAVEEADKEEGVIPLKTLETSEEDSIETKASGSKTVGTKATGRVKIVNRDASNSKKFFKGTVITPVSGAKISFTLNQTATLSAAPVGCENDCPQKGVDITSKVIGSSGNLKSGTVFKVGDANVNLVFAKNETNFSGGSSEKLTVVSAEDQKKAKEDLLEKMEKGAKKSLEEKNPGATIPAGGLKNEIINQTYSQNIGDEADSFRLSMQVEFLAKSFSEIDLENFLVSEIEEKIPNDFTLDKENILVSSEILGEDQEGLNVLGKIKAALLPKVNEEEIRRNIAGKNFGSVDNYLKSLNSVSGFEIKVAPLPFRIFGILPFMGGRIKIEVVQEE